MPSAIQMTVRGNQAQSMKRSFPSQAVRRKSVPEEFDDDELDDMDLTEAIRESDFADIDSIVTDKSRRSNDQKLGHSKAKKSASDAHRSQAQAWEPTLLKNGKWACNHKCKDKRHCKHICCREGVDKPPKPPKNPESVPTGQQSIADVRGFSKQTKPGVVTSKPASCGLAKRKDDHDRSSPSTVYGDDSDLFDDDELQNDSTYYFASKTSGHNGQSIFLNDTSSPEKMQNFQTLDLTGNNAGLATKRSHVIANNHRASGADANKKKQRLDSTNGGRAGLTRTRQLENIPPSFVNRQQQESEEFDDPNFGDEDFKSLDDHHHPSSVYDDPDVEEVLREHGDSFADLPFDQSVREGMKSTYELKPEPDPRASYLSDIPHRSFDAEQEDLGLLRPVETTPRPPQTYEENGELDQNMSTRHDEKSISDDEKTVGTDAWLRKEYGEYVNFI